MLQQGAGLTGDVSQSASKRARMMAPQANAPVCTTAADYQVLLTGHLLLCCLVRHVRKTRKFFSKYADHVIAKYAAKICRNRPRLHIRVNLTWYIFGGMGQHSHYLVNLQHIKAWKVHV